MSCSEWKETEVEKIPSHWEVITIDEIADVKGGKRLPKGESLQENKTPYPYIRLVDILNNRVDKTNIMYLTKDVQSKISRYIVEKDDICLAIVGNTIGLVFYITENEDKFNLTENAARITNLDTSKINSKFLFYYLNSKSGQHKIKSSQVGSAQGKLPIKNIKSISIPLPPLNEQEKIADVLSSLDNKIELNNEMNKTLEEMAKSIFKRWFVDFEFPNEDGQPYKSSGGEMVESELGIIPIWWEVKTIADIGEVISGGTPSTKNEDYYGGDISWITPKDLSGYDRKFITKGERSITELGLQKSSAKLLPKGTVLFSSRAPIGYVAISDKEVCTNQGFKSIVCNTEIMNNNYVYYFLKFNKKNIENVSSGSTFKEISGTHMKNFKIIVPNKDILDNFNKIIISYDGVLSKNYEEIDNLTEIKDTLLTKLMNGEIILNN